MESFHRRNLPHLYKDHGSFFVTYRLYGSIPLARLAQIQDEMKGAKDDGIEIKRIFAKYDAILDKAEYGPKYLSNPDIADICKETIRYPDRKDYKLVCYTIMSNHVHLLFTLLENARSISINKIMQSIKRKSARECNKLLNQTGDTFWQSESFDRWVRNGQEFMRILNYILYNPVKAGLVDSWNKWPNTFLCSTE